MITKYLENLPLQSVSSKRDLQALEHKVLSGFLRYFVIIHFALSLYIIICAASPVTVCVHDPYMLGHLQEYSKTLRPTYINFAQKWKIN